MQALKLFLGGGLALMFAAGALGTDAGQENDSAQQGKTMELSEDRYYLESECPRPGIQEVLLKSNGDFVLTTFNADTRHRITEFEGEWSMDREIRSLRWDREVARFQTRSRVHQLIGEKFLYLSFKHLHGEGTDTFSECEFVDRRVLDRFFNRKKKPATE